MNKIVERGQSLWETLLALAMAGLIAFGVIKLTSFAVKDTRFSKDQSQATAMAQEKIGIIIKEKNDDETAFWNSLPSNTTDPSHLGYCLLTSVIDKTGALTLPTTDPDYIKAKMAQIIVKVFWDEKGEGADCDGKSYSHSIQFDTYVTN